MTRPTYEECLGASVDTFIEDATVEARKLLPARDMYAAYVSWAEGRDETPMTETLFGRAASRHVERRRQSAGRVYVGIALKDPASPS